jgi:hypothetical protein
MPLDGTSRLFDRFGTKFAERSANREARRINQSAGGGTIINNSNVTFRTNSTHGTATIGELMKRCPSSELLRQRASVGCFGPVADAQEHDSRGLALSRIQMCTGAVRPHQLTAWHEPRSAKRWS